MDLRAFKIRLVDKSFVMLDEDTFLFRKQKGKWEVWESQTDESHIFPSLEDASTHKLESGNTVMDLIGAMNSLDVPLEGGRGSGSGAKRKFKFTSAGGKGGPSKGDLPARINVHTKNKSVEGAIATFRKAAAKQPKREHGVTVGREGFATQYVHGQAHSVAIGAKNKGEIIIHNHPSNGTFSGKDLISVSSQKKAHGVVATYNKGYRIFTKGTHFKGEEFTKAVKRARPTGKNQNEAIDNWLTRNQKKYGYKFKNVKD